MCWVLCRWVGLRLLGRLLGSTAVVVAGLGQEAGEKEKVRVGRLGTTWLLVVVWGGGDCCLLVMAATQTRRTMKEAGWGGWEAGWTGDQDKWRLRRLPV